MISNHENFARSALRNAMPIESRETVDVTSGMVNWRCRRIISINKTKFAVMRDPKGTDHEKTD
jgi:hypothetical protein